MVTVSAGPGEETRRDPRRAMRVSELGQAAWMLEFFSRADDASRRALGMAQARVGGGVVTVMAGGAPGPAPRG